MHIIIIIIINNLETVRNTIRKVTIICINVMNKRIVNNNKKIKKV